MFDTSTIVLNALDSKNQVASVENNHANVPSTIP
jgi:hypothetical protein